MVMICIEMKCQQLDEGSDDDLDECEILDKERRIPTFSMHNMYCIACMMNMMYDECMMSMKSMSMGIVKVL